MPITTLHFDNVPLSGYIDDFFTKRDTFSICEKNGKVFYLILKTLMLLQRLALTIEKPIALTSIDLEYFYDSSSYFWSANFNKHKIDGAWNMKEKYLHISCKELLVVYYSLISFKTYLKNKHVKIFSDSQVGVQIMNKMRTTKSSICKDIVKNI